MELKEAIEDLLSDSLHDEHPAKGESISEIRDQSTDAPVVGEKELLDVFKGNMTDAEFAKDIEDQKRLKYKKEYNGDPYGNEQKGKSAIVSRDIKKQSEWQHASIVDPFVSSSDIIKCSPVTFEDREAADQNQLVLNTQFCRQFDRFNFVTKSVKVMDQEGTVVVQTGWENETIEEDVEVVKIETDEYGNEYVVEGEFETIKRKVVVKNQPTAKVCRNEDIFIDPTCMDNIDDCQFVIYRYESDISTLRSDGRYKNLKKLSPKDTDSRYDGDYESEYDDEFTFKDEPRKKILVHEYWGNYDVDGDGIAEAIVCVWVNDVIIRLEENPYPDQKPPFVIAPFNSVPFKLSGEPNAALISDNQKVKTAIIRGIIDNMAQSNNAMKGIKKGALDATNKTRFLNGKNYEFNGDARTISIDGSYNEIPSSAFNMLSMMNNEIESITGVKSFSGGINSSSLGGTATGARGALDATSTRKLNIVRNYSENIIKPIMRKWSAYNAVFMQPEEIIRITNNEFVTVKRDDMQGRIDIDIQVSTAEDNAAKAQELAFMLQTMGQSLPEEITRMLMVEHLTLNKLPDAARKLEEYKPQPNPQQEEIQKLQIELLRAQVQNEYAKGTENAADTGLKKAKTVTEIKKAELTGAQSDVTNLDFMIKDQGIDRQSQLMLESEKHKMNMEAKEFDRIAGLDQEAFKRMAEKNAKMQTGEQDIVRRTV